MYDPDLVAPLAQTIRTALVGDGSSERKSGGTCPTALVASTVRNPDTFAKFRQELVNAQLTSQTINLDRAEWLGGWPVFPSTHDPATEGEVVLLEIKLA